MTPHPDPSYGTYNRGCRCSGCREAHRLHMQAWRQSRKSSEVESSVADAPSDAGRGEVPLPASHPAARKKRPKSAYGLSDSYRKVLATAPAEKVDDDRTCCHCLATFPSRAARKKHQCLPWSKIKPSYQPPVEPIQVIIRHPRYTGGTAA